MLIAKNFLTTWPSYKPSYLISCSQAGVEGTALPMVGRQGWNVLRTRQEYAFGSSITNRTPLIEIKRCPAIERLYGQCWLWPLSTGAGQLEVVGRGRPDFSAFGRPQLHQLRKGSCLRIVFLRSQ
jgi:hypothetical protein